MKRNCMDEIYSALTRTIDEGCHGNDISMEVNSDPHICQTHASPNMLFLRWHTTSSLIAPHRTLNPRLIALSRSRCRSRSSRRTRSRCRSSTQNNTGSSVEVTHSCPNTVLWWGLRFGSDGINRPCRRCRWRRSGR